MPSQRYPVYSFAALRKLTSELALIIKYDAQRGADYEHAFVLLCLTFEPLVNKHLPRIMQRTGVSKEDAIQELHATLFEAVTSFDWSRCCDENLFAFYVKRRLSYITEWRISRIMKDLPPAFVSRVPVIVEPSQLLPLTAVLTRVEEQLTCHAADLLFCMFELNMSQSDIGKVFGVSQKWVSVWWRDLIPKVRDLLSGIPDLGVSYAE